MDMVDGYCWWTWLMYIDGICQEECGQLVFSTIQNWNIHWWDVNGDTMGYVTNYIQLGWLGCIWKCGVPQGGYFNRDNHEKLLEWTSGSPKFPTNQNSACPWHPQRLAVLPWNTSDPPGKTATGVVFQKLPTPPSTPRLCLRLWNWNLQDLMEMF